LQVYSTKIEGGAFATMYFLARVKANRLGLDWV
jgi:hypothetical protein